MTWIDPPADFDGHSIAEFIESELIFSHDDYLSLTEIRGLFASGGQPTDDDIMFAISLIEARSELWNLYPFEAVDRGVRVDRGSTFALYAFLEILSIRGSSVRNGELPRSDSIFDAITREAFRGYLKCNVVVFAWPARDGRPNLFLDAVEWLGKKMGVEVRSSEVPDLPKDGGVDLVAWKPFNDGRSGFPVYLIQNTVQWDFRKKPRDVVPEKWHTWLKLGRVPTIGFAIPFLIPGGDPWWDEIAFAADVVMDRARIMEHLDDSSPETWKEWSRLVEIVESEVTSMRQRQVLTGEPPANHAARRKPSKRPAVSVVATGRSASELEPPGMIGELASRRSGLGSGVRHPLTFEKS